MEFENLLKFFLFLKDENYIDNDTLIQYSSGEITAHPMREKILEAFQYNPCLFFSNASIYNEELAEVLSKDGSKLISSVDAGTRETFAKIKGVDLFDKVCENLSRYAQNGLVQLKYIILPGLNDNEEDLNGIIAFCKRANIKQLSISRNTHDLNAFSEYTMNMIALLINNARKQEIYVTIPDFIFMENSDKQQLENKVQLG